MGGRKTLSWLENGNQRYVSGWARHPNQDAARRQQLVGGQRPEAVVVTCCDSRVVPTVAFDVGLGDLFEIQVAGNVASPTAVASVEFAVLELGCELCVVLGHGDCGAVKATLAAGDEALPGELGRLVDRIRPCCSAAAGDLDAAIRDNVRRQVEILRSAEPILSARVAEGRLVVVGAVYELASGRVEFMD
jgi:carbonic anhydrase